MYPEGNSTFNPSPYPLLTYNPTQKPRADTIPRKQYECANHEWKDQSKSVVAIMCPFLLLDNVFIYTLLPLLSRWVHCRKQSSKYLIWKYYNVWNVSLRILGSKYIYNIVDWQKIITNYKRIMDAIMS